MQGAECRVQGAGCRVQGARCRVHTRQAAGRLGIGWRVEGVGSGVRTRESAVRQGVGHIQVHPRQVYQILDGDGHRAGRVVRVPRRARVRHRPVPRLVSAGQRGSTRVNAGQRGPEYGPVPTSGWSAPVRAAVGAGQRESDQRESGQRESGKRGSAAVDAGRRRGQQTTRARDRYRIASCHVREPHRIVPQPEQNNGT